MEYESVDRTELAQDRVHLWVLVKKRMNLRALLNAGNVSTTITTVMFLNENEESLSCIMGNAWRSVVTDFFVCHSNL
jgi:hypothetical protein